MLPVSIVIPVFRDLQPLAERLEELSQLPDIEVIVSGVTEEMPAIERLLTGYPRCRAVTGARGRASQMNAGAAIARGEALLFLHADSRLDAVGLAALRQAFLAGGFAIGCFRFALDSDTWWAKVIEFGAARRVALLRMPYGDQGLFLSRTTFERLGGFRVLPVMEDADLVARARRLGPLRVLYQPMVTSARRWHREGWFRRTAWNYVLAGAYLSGVSPAWIARRHAGRRRAAIGLMARAPSSGGKTRLWRALGRSPDTRLATALLEDTASVAAEVGSADLVAYITPPDRCGEVPRLPGLRECLAQRGGHLGERMSAAFAELFGLGYDSVVLIGSDVPVIRFSDIEQALRSLRSPRGRVVLGPAEDGGYYLIGLNRPTAALFESVPWGTSEVLEVTRARAGVLGLDVRTVATRYDIDTPSDLDRLLEEPADVAPRTRAFWRDLDTAARR
jgi:rSAM/selenodomain-associated transferase 2/rSAM/selenodomain-associated transferase 1